MRLCRKAMKRWTVDEYILQGMGKGKSGVWSMIQLDNGKELFIRHFLLETAEWMSYKVEED